MLQNRIPRTALAEIYTHPRGKIREVYHEILRPFRPLKSGLTPLTPGPFDTVVDERHHDELELYQLSRFRGFTTSELHAVEALAPLQDELKEFSLGQVPIHPLLQRNKWDGALPKHIAKFPLGNGRDGYWEAQNPIVWNAIKPALKLASMFLQSSHTWPWFDALFFGDYRRIPPDDLPLDHKAELYGRFFRRSTDVTSKQSSVNALHQKLQEVCGKIDLHFRSGHLDFNTSLPEADMSFTHGETLGRGGCWTRTKLTVSFELAEPLLDNRITAAERMLNTFLLAQTILHESVHAMWQEIRRDHTDTVRSDNEPYFEDEILTELGYSLESHVFGGIGLSFIQSGRLPSHGVPQAGVFLCDWMARILARSGMVDDRDPVLCPEPRDFDYQNIYPIPVAYFADLHKIDFWNGYVKKYGSQGTHMGPKTIGMKVKYDQRSEGQPIPSNYQSLVLDHLIIDEGMSKTEVDTIKTENERRDQARRVTEAVRRAHDAADEADRNQQTFDMDVDSDSVSSDDSIDDDLPQLNPSLAHRHGEIITYLLTNRLQLALDTMDFEIPEHLLYSYILAHGGIVLSAAEWRDFLIWCNDSHTYFTWEEIGKSPTPSQGIITRIDEGWEGSVPMRTPYPDATKEAFEMFDAATRHVIGRWHRFDADALPDYDKEEFRRGCNRALRILKYADSLSEQDFDACIYDCEIRGDRFTFGPEGMIRRLKTGW